MRAIDLGFHLGIGGVITFKNAGVAEVIQRLPISKLILKQIHLTFHQLHCGASVMNQLT